MSEIAIEDMIERLRDALQSPQPFDENRDRIRRVFGAGEAVRAPAVIAAEIAGALGWGYPLRSLIDLVAKASPIALERAPLLEQCRALRAAHALVLRTRVNIAGGLVLPMLPRTGASWPLERIVDELRLTRGLAQAVGGVMRAHTSIDPQDAVANLEDALRGLQLSSEVRETLAGEIIT